MNKTLDLSSHNSSKGCKEQLGKYMKENNLN